MFGQLVIGPPGSGKSTYCTGMLQFLTGCGRQCVIVNLDPANDRLPYSSGGRDEADEADNKFVLIDVMQDIVDARKVMEERDLGPNGALMESMQYLDQNFQQLLDKINAVIEQAGDQSQHLYWLFDCPGQVELFTHDQSLKNIIQKISSQVPIRLCAVNLMDSQHCTDPYRFISIVLLAMKMMLHLELPHVNVLSKCDLLENDELQCSDKMRFNIDYYCEVQDLRYLLQDLNQEHDTAAAGDYNGTSAATIENIPRRKWGQRFHKLNEALVGMIEDFGLVSFYPLKVEDKKSMNTILRVIDKANGYVFGAFENGNESIMETVARVGRGYMEDLTDYM